jgi:hypothetical protein
MTSTTNNVVVDESSSLASVDGEAVCYLCLDGGVDEANQPLRRDCACRGTDAGYVHLSCLAGYAATKSKQTTEMNDFVLPWYSCPSCHQEYQNELAVDIASKFVSFVRRQYPKDTQSQVESLYVKLRALNNMLDRCHPCKRRETGVTADIFLSLIDRMKTEVSPLTMRYSQFQAFAYNVHGRILSTEGTEESARRAVVHFERVLVVCAAIGDDQGIASAKSNIALAKSVGKQVDGDRTEELLNASRELYQLGVTKSGEENASTIYSGYLHAKRLKDANRREEARELLTKLFVTSKQVLGPHHSITKKVEHALIQIDNVTFINSTVLVCILIGVLAILCNLFHHGKIVPNGAAQV